MLHPHGRAGAPRARHGEAGAVRPGRGGRRGADLRRRGGDGLGAGHAVPAADHAQRHGVLRHQPQRRQGVHTLRDDVCDVPGGHGGVYPGGAVPDRRSAQ